MSITQRIKRSLNADQVLESLGCETPKKPGECFKCPCCDKPSCRIWSTPEKSLHYGFDEDYTNENIPCHNIEEDNGKGVYCHECGYNRNLFELVQDELRLSETEAISWFIKEFPLMQSELLEETDCLISTEGNLCNHIPVIPPPLEAYGSNDIQHIRLPIDRIIMQYNDSILVTEDDEVHKVKESEKGGDNV